MCIWCQDFVRLCLSVSTDLDLNYKINIELHYYNFIMEVSQSDFNDHEAINKARQVFKGPCILNTWTCLQKCPKNKERN